MALSRRRILKTEEVVKEESVEDTVDQLLIEINSPELAARLQELRVIATRPLSLLTSDQWASMESIRKLSRLAYSTPAYSVLHSHVMRLFVPEGEQPTIYAPHTVGSFFVGSMATTNLREVAPDVNQGCSILCSDALPPPEKPWGFCSQNVLWCQLSSSANARNLRSSVDLEGVISSSSSLFDFIHITQIPSSSKAIIFVDYPTYDEFPGFTRHEKARLIHRLRITDIKLLSYNREPTRMEYKDLIGSVIKVHKIKSRADPRDNETVAQRTSRRAKVSKITDSSIPTYEYPLSWQHMAGLTLVLAMIVILGICAVFALRSSVQTSKRSKAQWRT